MIPLLNLVLPALVAGRVLEEAAGGDLHTRQSIPYPDLIGGLGTFLGNLGGGSGGGLGGLGGLFSNLGGLMVGGTTPPFKVQNLPAEVLPSGATRKRLIFGPFKFKPADLSKVHSHEHSMSGPVGLGTEPMDPNGQIIMRTVDGFCSDCTVVYGSTYVAHEDGSRVTLEQGAYLHHLVIMNPLDRTAADYYVCREKPGQTPRKAMMPLTYFLGAGVDESEYFFTTTDGKFDSGYYIPKEQKTFVLQSEVVNYSQKEETWYLAAEFEFIPGHRAGKKGDVSVTDISVTGCETLGAPGYYPPSGQARHEKGSPEFIFTKDGTILSSLSHMHDGGDSMQLLLNGKVICTSTATYGGPQGTLVTAEGEKWETISHMSTCRNPVPVKKGDVLTMKAVYDTDRHPLRKAMGGMRMEVMGIYTIFFTEQASAPTKQR